MHWKPLFEDSRPGSKSDIYICIGTTHKTFRTSSEQRENVRSSMGLKRSDFPTCWEENYPATNRSEITTPSACPKANSAVENFRGLQINVNWVKKFSLTGTKISYSRVANSRPRYYCKNQLFTKRSN